MTATAARPFRIYAHRGASAELPENTLVAFGRALELGVDALETDVHVTRDGAVVVHHDATGLRTAKVDRAIADTDLEDVRKWDVGRGMRVPTLEELFDTCPSVTVNVDIKAHTKRAAQHVVDLVRKRGESQRVTLTSVDDAVVRHVRALGYEGAVGLGRASALLVLATPRAVLAGMRSSGLIGGDALQIPWRFKGVRFDHARLVRRGHAAGLRVDYWTVNDPAIARRIVSLGADGIMTDDPRCVVRSIREARAELAAS
ncbi:MAG: glycerophosphodiester phosphodiesterase family protein [Myxococcota bacterium]